MIRTVPSLKRKVKAEVNGSVEKVVLDRVFGLTAFSNSAFVSHPESGLLAYPAGCVIVIVDVKQNKQTHLINASKKSIVSLSFCSDGKHIASGESGHAPAVRVWDIDSGQQIAELTDHTFSVPCVAFSPNGKYLFSIGNQYDNVINVWNWKTGKKVASNKNTQKVNALCFSPDSSHAVSVGIRHVRFWYMQIPHKHPGSAPPEAVPLSGKIAPLGDLQNNNFVGAVYSNEKSLVVLTHSGYLCQFNADNRQLQNTATINTKKAFCLAASLDDGLLYVGCANGTIRIYNGSTLEPVGMLPRPHKLGVDLQSPVSDTSYVYGEEPDTQICADTIGLVWLGDCLIAATYSDHSIYVWNVADLDRVTKAASWMFHSTKIWGIDIFPADAEQPLMPADSFITCSGDDTIRIWNFADSSSPQSAYNSHSFRNPFSKELVKIIYVDSNYANLCDNESLVGGTEMSGIGPSPSSVSSFVPFGSSSTASTPSTGSVPALPLDNRGVRCVTVSPDGYHICAGLRSGFIKIFDIREQFSNKITVQAHDGEILALEYSRGIDDCPQMLASGGRDRFVHVLNASDNYSVHQTFNTDHSSSITALKFSQKISVPVQTANGSNAGDEKLQMLLMSCSADKSILIRSADVAVGSDSKPIGVGQFSLASNVGNKATLYDMETEPTQRFVAVACQDRMIRVISIATGKLRCKYRGSSSEDGTLLRFSLDPTGTLFAAACSDKTVSIIDFYTGELLATVSGHSEQITGVKFLPDLKRFVTVSADSCIFVWRLSNDLVKLLTTRLDELRQGIIRPLSIKAQTTTAPQSAQKKFNASRSTSVEEQLSSLATSSTSSVPGQSMIRRPNTIVPSVSHTDLSRTNSDRSQLDLALQLTETSVDDPAPSVSSTSSRPSTRAKWGDRLPSNGSSLIIKTAESNLVDIEIDPRKTAWACLDDDEEIVEEEDDISAGQSAWLSGGKITSPPRSANRLWSHLPAAGPSSPRQSVTEEASQKDDESVSSAPPAPITVHQGLRRSPSANSALHSRATATPPRVPLTKLLEQNKQHHLANKTRQTPSEDPSVFKKPAPVDGIPVSSRSSSLVRRSRTATDLAAAATHNGTFSRPTPKIPAFMQPTMSSAAKNSRMPRSSSSTMIAAESGNLNNSRTSTSNLHARRQATIVHHNRTTPQKAMFQSTPDLSGAKSASAAIANAIFSETDTDAEDNASSIGGASDLHERMISLPRSPAERKAFALKAMRQNRNRSGSESAISPKPSISATFDDDDDDEPDSGVQQDSGRSGGSDSTPTGAKVNSPQSVISDSSKSNLAPPVDGQYKSKVLANAMLRAGSPTSSIDSSSTTGTGNSESPGNILRRELEREMRALQSSPSVTSPPTVAGLNQTIPPPIASKPSIPPNMTGNISSSPLRRGPPIGIVHPSNPVQSTTTIPADPAKGPLVRLIDQSLSNGSPAADEIVKPTVELAKTEESPVSTRVNKSFSTPTSNGSPQQSLGLGSGKRRNVVLLSNLRRPITSPSNASSASPVPVSQYQQPAVTAKSSPQTHAINTKNVSPLNKDGGGSGRDRSLSVENLSMLHKNATKNGHGENDTASELGRSIGRTNGMRNIKSRMTNGTVANVGSSLQQRKMAMSMHDLRANKNNLRSTANGHSKMNGMDPDEEQEHIEDVIKAWQSLTSKLIVEFDRFQSVPRAERNGSEERSRKRLLQAMLEARRKFDRCQERASEDLFS